MSNFNLFAYTSEKTTQQTTGTLNSSGNPVVPPLTVDENDYQYRELPAGTFAESAAAGTVPNSAVSLSVYKVKANSDDLDSYISLPILSPALVSDSILSKWFPSGDTYSLNAFCVYPLLPGVYVPSSGWSGLLVATTGSIASLCNPAATVSFGIMVFNVGGGEAPASVAIGISFNPPVINTTVQNSFEFDTVALGIRGNWTMHGARGSGAGYGQQRVALSCKKFYVNGYLNVDNSVFEVQSNTSQEGSIYLGSIPDEYFIPPRNTGDIDMVKEPQIMTDGSYDIYGKFTGFQSFKCANVTQDNFEQFRQFGLFLQSNNIVNVGQICNFTSGSATVYMNTSTMESTAAAYTIGDHVVALTQASGSAPIIPSAVYKITATSGGTGGSVTLDRPFTEGTFTGIYLNSALADISLDQLALIFHKSVSVKEAVYSPMNGRTFGGPSKTFDAFDNIDNEGLVWGSRRTGSAMIADPLDILEHVKRLQCFSEIAVPTQNVGKEYDQNALIRTGTTVSSAGDYNGSFDNPNFGVYSDVSPCTTFGLIRACRPAFQIFDDSKGWTEQLGKQLCKTFGILSYIGPDGYECVESFAPYGAASLVAAGSAITFADLAEKAGEVIEPQIQDVFCEPSVEYGYDAGPGKYQQFLIVSNTNQATWSAQYTPGYNNGTSGAMMFSASYDPFNLFAAHGGPFIDATSDGQYIWTVCRQLYLKYGQVEKCPSDFSECALISVYNDALYYVVYKLQCMRYRRMSLSVFYGKGSGWHFGQHLAVSLPVLTPPGSSGPVWSECLIEKIQKCKNQNRVKVNLVILDPV